MPRTFLLIVSIVLAVVGLGGLGVGLAQGNPRGLVTGVLLLGNSAWLFMWSVRARQHAAWQAELMQRPLRDGSRLADVIGREWVMERPRLEAMAELVAEDLPDITWLPGEGPRRVRQQMFRSEEWVIRFYVAAGKIRKVHAEPRVL